MKITTFVIILSFLITSQINASVTVENLSNGEIVVIQNSYFDSPSGGNPAFENWIPPVSLLTFSGGDSLKITWDWISSATYQQESYYLAPLSYRSYEYETSYEDYMSRFWNTYSNNATYSSRIYVGSDTAEYSENFLGNMENHNPPSFFHVYQVPNGTQQIDVQIGSFNSSTTTYFPIGNMYVSPAGPDNTGPYDIFVEGSLKYTYSAGNNSNRFTLVPEPSAISLLAVGLGVVLRRRRRTV